MELNEYNGKLSFAAIATAFGGSEAVTEFFQRLENCGIKINVSAADFIDEIGPLTNYNLNELNDALGKMRLWIFEMEVIYEYQIDYDVDIFSMDEMELLNVAFENWMANRADVSTEEALASEKKYYRGEGNVLHLNPAPKMPF